MNSKQEIHKLLNDITATREEIYHWFADHRLTFSERKIWGFPVYDLKNPNKINLFTHAKFSRSTNPSKQTCRCGKFVSLLQKDWYIDDNGCCFHSGKRTFSDGPDYGLYTCCRGKIKKDGCMYHKYHACSFKYTGDNSFIRAERPMQPRLDSSNIFALDTEMVYTTGGLEVARVSLLSLAGNIIVDQFVQPENLILDYNTPYSGIVPADLNGVKTTLADAQALLLKVLNHDSILIGHGLENDLIAIRLIHDNIVDTSIVYRHENGFPYRTSLKTLSQKYLNKEIYTDTTAGHNSVEDARICLHLMLKRLYLQSLNPYFYIWPKVYPTPPPIQDNPNFYAQTPPPNYIKPIPVVNGQTVLVPKLWQVSQFIPMSFPRSVFFNPLTQFGFH